MPTGVAVADGIVQSVGVAVQRLRVPRLRYDGIGLQEAAQCGVVETGAVVVEAEGRFSARAGGGSHHFQFQEVAFGDPRFLHRPLHILTNHTIVYPHSST